MTGNRAAVLHDPGDLRVEERPTPAPGAGDVLIEVSVVGVCGSDVHYYREGRIGDFVVGAPLVLGHEAAGLVVAVGPGVDPVRVGERVAVEPGVPCRRCTACKTGRYNLCPDMRFLATPPVDGAFTRFLTIPADFAHPIPPGMRDEEAALCEPLAVGVWANRRAEVQPGDRVLVTGAGPVGLLAAQVAAVRGAEVTVIDPSPARRSLAASVGLSDSHPEIPRLRVDVLLECSGAPEALASGLATLNPAGRAVVVGMGADLVPLPLPLLQTREISLTGTFRYANCYPAAVSLARRHAVHLAALVGSRFGLDQVEEALLASTRDPSIVKAFVYPQHTSLPARDRPGTPTPRTSQGGQE